MRTWLLGLMVAVAAVGCGDDDRPPLMRDGGGADTSIPGVDSGPPGCTPGQYACAGSTRYLCGEDGMTRLNEEVCPAACSPTEGCVACMPGQRQCNGTVSMVCAPDGSGFVSGRDCAEFGSTCGSSGFCADACAEAESTRSNIGCEYWAVPMANDETFPGRYDFRIVIANPNEVAVNVRVFRGTSMVASQSVDANGVRDIVLPWIEGVSDAYDFASPSSRTTANGAYRVLSDRPVTVAQFNPFEYDNGRTVDDIRDPLFGEPDYSYTNDASLLLPAHAMTGRYVATAYQAYSLTRQFPQQDPIFGTITSVRQSSKVPSYLVLVGMTPEPTQVSIGLSTAVLADASGRFPATPRGGTLNFTLARGEVVHVVGATPPQDCAAGRPGYRRESQGFPDGCTQPQCEVVFEYCSEAEFDISGSTITANRPLVAFGGHLCAFVPYDRFACDHLEAQLPPLETWGTNFNTAPMADPSGQSVNRVRVTAALADTTVTITPAQDGLTTLSLGAGQWRELSVTSPVQLSSNRGILVSQFLVGQQASEPEADRGDPAMLIIPPREQFRRDYDFVAPTSYNASTDGQNYILVVRSPGQTISLDGAPINPTWTAGGDRETGIVPISGGTHRMESSDTFGVLVFGMGINTSYAYPAGLNLEEILLI